MSIRVRTLEKDFVSISTQTGTDINYPNMEITLPSIRCNWRSVKILMNLNDNMSESWERYVL